MMLDRTRKGEGKSMKTKICMMLLVSVMAGALVLQAFGGEKLFELPTNLKRISFPSGKDFVIEAKGITIVETGKDFVYGPKGYTMVEFARIEIQLIYTQSARSRKKNSIDSVNVLYLTDRANPAGIVDMWKKTLSMNRSMKLQVEGVIVMGGGSLESDVGGVADFSTTLSPDGKTVTASGKIKLPLERFTPQAIGLVAMSEGSPASNFIWVQLPGPKEGAERYNAIMEKAPNAAMTAGGLPRPKGPCATLVGDDLENLPKSHRSRVSSVMISPDGTLLASGSYDDSIKLWTLPEGEHLKTLTGHVATVNSLAMSPDGKLLASASSDKTVKIWTLPEGQLQATLTGFADQLSTLAISPDGKLLVSGDYGKSITLWTMSNPGVHWQSEMTGDESSAVYDMVISPDGSHLISGGDDKTVKLWTLPEGKPLGTLTGHTAGVTALAISMDGKLLASGGGSSDREIRLWTAPKYTPLVTMTGHTDSVFSMAFSPDGKQLASGGRDNTIRLWTLPEGKIQNIIEVPGRSVFGVQSVAFSPNGKYLVSGDDDGRIFLLELSGAQRRWVLKDPIL